MHKKEHVFWNGRSLFGGQEEKKKKTELLPKSAFLENDGNLKYLHNRWWKYLTHLLQGKEMAEFTDCCNQVSPISQICFYVSTEGRRHNFH